MRSNAETIIAEVFATAGDTFQIVTDEMGDIVVTAPDRHVLVLSDDGTSVSWTMYTHDQWTNGRTGGHTDGSVGIPYAVEVIGDWAWTHNRRKAA